MAAYIYTISVQAEIISLILYHNSTFIITNLSKPDEISFVVGECHLNSEASLPPPPHHHHSNKEFPLIVMYTNTHTT
jgi:hypothetical protein